VVVCIVAHRDGFVPEKGKGSTIRPTFLPGGHSFPERHFMG